MEQEQSEDISSDQFQNGSDSFSSDQLLSMQSNQESLLSNTTSRTELQFFKKKQEEESKCLNPEWKVSFAHFPTEFGSLEDALNKYNMLGLPLKIQFKRYNTRRDDTGFITQFSFCCYKRAGARRKITQGIKIKADNLVDCPVVVRFKWCQDRMGYLRSRAYKDHHSHPIDIKD